MDRSFSIKGFGTIVTGTLIDGPMTNGGEVWLYPGGRRLRIRNMQVHDRDVWQAEPPQRTALNLAGIPAEPSIAAMSSVRQRILLRRG